MKNKALLIAGIILAAAALIFAFYKPFLLWLQKRKAKTLSTETMEGEKITPGAATWPLQKGKKGIEILYWQAYLNLFKGATIETLDGIWGNETERENNDHYKQKAIPQPVYASLVLPNMVQIVNYVNTKPKN